MEKRKILFGLFCFLVLHGSDTAHAAIPLSRDSTAECTAEGGVCTTRVDERCTTYSTPTISYDPIGKCDGGTFTCCKAGGATGGTGPGTDYYCVNTHKGACAQESRGCPSGTTRLDACSTDASGARKICCSIPAPVGALNYTLLEEIPGQSGTTGDLNLYLQKLYSFTFWAVGIAALFMLTVGGFMYVTSAGNTSRISTAKTIIFDSILGILIALFAWLFLYVLNPDLVEGLSLPTSSPTAPPSSTGGTTPPAASGDVKTLAAKILAGGTGITLSSSGSCSTASGSTISPRFTIEEAASAGVVTRCQKGCPGTGACTQQTSLSSRMLQAMLTVAKTYPFTVTSISGGSHSATSQHYSGTAIDISTGNKGDWPNIVKAFRDAGSNGGQTFCDLGGANVACSTASHIHVGF